MKTLSSLKLKPLFFISTKDVNGDIWIYGWRRGPSLHDNGEWRFYEADTFARESFTSDTFNRFLFFKRTVVEKKFIELLKRGPEFWDLELTGAPFDGEHEIDETELFALKTSCKCRVMTTSVSEHKPHSMRRKYNNGLTYEANEARRKEGW